MKKIWLVFKHEYVRRVKTRGFIFAVLSMPLLVILSSLMALISVKMQTNTLPAGYIDLSGAVETTTQIESPSTFDIGTIDLLAFTDVESGQEALANDEIQAFFIIQEDYLESGLIDVYANERPGDNAFSQMQNFLASNLIAPESSIAKERIPGWQ